MDGYSSARKARQRTAPPSGQQECLQMDTRLVERSGVRIRVGSKKLDRKSPEASFSLSSYKLSLCSCNILSIHFISGKPFQTKHLFHN